MVKIRLLLSIVAVSCLVTRPQPLVAICAEPLFVLSPDNSRSVPPDPRIFFFRAWDLFQVRVETLDGGDVEINQEVEVVHSNEVYDVSELNIKAAAGSRFKIVIWNSEYDSVEPREYVYEVEDAEPSGPREFVSLKDITEENSSWTCSYQETINIKPSRGAPAYRLVWAKSGRDYVSGKTSEIIFPKNLRLFFNIFSDRKETSVRPEIELGHVNCFGWTHRWNGRPIWIGISALFPDGSETPLPQRGERILPFGSGKKGGFLSSWFKSD